MFSVRVNRSIEKNLATDFDTANAGALRSSIVSPKSLGDRSEPEGLCEASDYRRHHAPRDASEVGPASRAGPAEHRTSWRSPVPLGSPGLRGCGSAALGNRVGDLPWTARYDLGYPPQYRLVSVPDDGPVIVFWSLHKKCRPFSFNGESPRTSGSTQLTADTVLKLRNEDEMKFIQQSVSKSTRNYPRMATITN